MTVKLPPPLKETLAGVKRGTQKDMYAEMFYHAAVAHWLYLPQLAAQ